MYTTLLINFFVQGKGGGCTGKEGVFKKMGEDVQVKRGALYRKGRGYTRKEGGRCTGKGGEGVYRKRRGSEQEKKGGCRKRREVYRKRRVYRKRKRGCVGKGGDGV